MTKSEILAFLNENQVCFLATAEGTTPHVRGMMLYRADEAGIIFHTGKGKDMEAQLRNNPAVELCVFNPQTNVQIRVAGIVEFVEEQALKEEIVAARPFMKPMIEKAGYGFLAVLRVTNCVATVWTMEANMAPKTTIALA